ncbi:MAG: CoB--CoM heterodisulfide reductase iron-sulfur subunit B family protein [Sedimentisphaerales bacterium]|nr:CoB--CoM heterodisulfide reductase iron-sulfur subunit B family protein [Sedimentisphaerales bacterium]
MKIAYFPGCSAESTARDMHASTIAVAKSLGIDLIEPEGWSCCGATAAHQTNPVLAAALPTANLLLAQQMKMDMVASCAACFNRLKSANHKVQSDSTMRKQVAEAVGQDYDGAVKVRHFLEVLFEDVGLDTIKAAIKRSLNGLKVACYYGCLMVRPHEVMNFDDPENPTSLDRLVEAMGGEALDWPHKVECCGGGLAMSRTDVVIKLTDGILQMAQNAGADCITVSCPMCQVNLDLRQKDIKKQMGRDYGMPIIYITQLLGLCLGNAPNDLGLDKLIVPPTNVIATMTQNG